MNPFTAVIALLVLFFFVYWLRILPFREKKTKEPERTAKATLAARQVQSGTRRSGRSQGMGYSFLLTFQTEDGKVLELYAYDHEYGDLKEGMTGNLTWKGPYFVRFETNT